MNYKELDSLVDRFVKEYTHLWTDGKKDGLSGAGIGVGGVILVRGTSQEVLDKVPDEYEGVKVMKVLGKVVKSL